MAGVSIHGLRKFVAPEFVFGQNARSLTGRYARNLGASKILVVTDDGVMKAGWVEPILTQLRESSLAYVVYSSVNPNPRDNNVMQGAELYRQEKCNFLLAIGGGSPIDCAKGIGIVSTNNRNILDFEGVDRIEYPCVPLICVPTTAGSSADVSQFAIILDRQNNKKIAIISKAVVPDISLIDPDMLSTAPDDLLACTGMDALTHAFEAYVSNARSDITNLHALEAIRLISSSLPAAYRNRGNDTALKSMMLGSLHAGLAFSNASLGAVHAMAHSLGGMLDLPHGMCNAILLEPIVGYNYDKVPELYNDIASAMGLQPAPGGQARSRLLASIAELRASVGIPDKIAATGAVDTGRLADNALKDACIVTNPILPTWKDVKAIYESIL